MVERFFAEITRKRIRRGVFKSVDELKQAIMDYLDNHNGHPKPYVWTKTAAEIFSKVASAKQALESQHQRGSGSCGFPGRHRCGRSAEIWTWRGR